MIALLIGGTTVGHAQEKRVVPPVTKATKPVGSQIRKQGTNTPVNANKESGGVTTEYSQIIPYLQKQADCQGQNTHFKVNKEVQIGPGKTAYAGVCSSKRMGWGVEVTRVVVLYEVTPNGLRKLFQTTFDSESPTSGNGLTKLSITKHVTKGYYDF
ncbi:MAG: hypothetical protein ACJ73D_10270, partial [Pyrinomonadaceae bacterium]